MSWKTFEEETPPEDKKILIFMSKTKKYRIGKFRNLKQDGMEYHYWCLPSHNNINPEDAWMNFEFYTKIETYE
jgi:hypothetical protein